MKSLFAFTVVVVETTLAYLWLAVAYEAAGRVLIFWLWAQTIVFFFMAGLLGHPSFKRPPPPSKSPRLIRYFFRAAIAVRVLGLAAIDRPVLAGLYLVSVVLGFLMLGTAEKPVESKEGA